MDIHLAIFDLGRVVFDFDWGRAFDVWSRYTSLPEGISEADLDDGTHGAFERGEIPAEDFHAHVVRKFGLTLSFDPFAEGWNAIYGAVYPEVEGALRRLSGRLPLAAFTNTNELHRPAFEARFAPTLALFDEVFVSSRIGMRKPEPEGFELVLGRYGVRPAEALFFDDVGANVRAAAALGIHGVHVRQPPDVVRALGGHGLLGVDDPT